MVRLNRGAGAGWIVAASVAVGAAALNVGVALLGNFVGGGVLIEFYYAFLNDPRRGRTTD